MASTTQRLKYYDGEYLQSSDFTDEQSYHVAMRRLLNQELHLHGIVKGLHMVPDASSVPSTPAQFLSVTAGFAIDQIGREIYVTAPVSLTPLLSPAGLQTGTCEIWIVYTETASGSPAPGYQLCNQLSQNTRWAESFSLMARNPSVVPAPGTPNPNLDLKGICLGLVNLNYNSTIGFYFTLPPNWYSRRSYVKIRAQSIIAPDDIAEPNAYVFYGPAPDYNFPPSPEGYIHVKTPNGVYSDGNMLVQGNMLIGDDFILNPTNPAVTGLPNTPLPSATGNVKIAGDLFLQGQFLYEQSADNWVSLTSPAPAPDVQFMPNIANPAPITVTISGNVTGPFTSPAITLNTTLTSFSSVDVQASIAGFELIRRNNLETWLTTAAATALAGISLSGITVTPTSGTSTTNVKITVDCVVTGDLTALTSVFETVSVAFVVIFRP